MSLKVVGYPEITELTTLELSSVVITPTSVVDLEVSQQDEVQVIVNEITNNVEVAEGIIVNIPSLDDVPDGVQYAKVIAEVLEEGKVILAQAIGTLDDIQDGINYAKILASAAVDGLITLEEVIGTLDDIAEGVTYGKVKLSALQAGTGFVLTDYLINGTYAVLKASALDVNGFVVMDNLIDGTYARVKASGLTAEGLVVLDETVDGTYSKVLTTSVLAGLIKITELVSDAGDAADLDDLPDGVSYARVASTSISAGKIKLDEGILDGTTYARVRSTVLEAGKILLAETVAVGGGAATIDNLADGTTYKRIKAVALDVNGLVVASQIQDAGGYTSRILSSTVSAGKIVLTSSDYSGFTANYVAEVSGKYWSPVSDSPAGTGLFITTDYIGYYTASAWTCYIKNDGTFKFYGNATNYVQWNGSAMTVRGVLTLADVTGAGALAALNSVAYGDITGTKPPTNADVTLAAINGGLSLTGGGLTLASGGASLKGGQTAYDTGTGFWLGDVSGVTKFSVGNASGNKLTWNGSALNIVGSGSFTGVVTASSGSFTGAVTATSGSFSGTITAAAGSNIAGWLTTATLMYDATSTIAFDSSNKKITVGSVSGARVQLSGAGYESGISTYNASSQEIGVWSMLDGGTYNQSYITLRKYVGGSLSLALSLLPGAIGFGSTAGTISATPLTLSSTGVLALTGTSITVSGSTTIVITAGSTLTLNASSGITLSPGSNITANGNITFATTKGIYFSSTTNNFIRHTSGSFIYYEAGDSHRMYIAGVEKFWVHNAGVGVVNTNFSVTTGYKVYLDAYNGAVYASCPAANVYRITATYFEITANNLTSNNGAIAVGASTNAGYLFFRSGGVNYKIQGTAI